MKTTGTCGLTSLVGPEDIQTLSFVASFQEISKLLTQSTTIELQAHQQSDLLANSILQVFIAALQVSLSSSNFTLNSATALGGGLSCDGCKLNVSDVKFLTNHADNYGGALNAGNQAQVCQQINQTTVLLFLLHLSNQRFVFGLCSITSRQWCSFLLVTLKVGAFAVGNSCRHQSPVWLLLCCYIAPCPNPYWELQWTPGRQECYPPDSGVHSCFDILNPGAPPDRVLMPSP